jgi:hypothetical protein
MQMNMSQIHIDSIPEEPTKGTLVVIANVVNDGSGTSVPANFSMNVSGGTVSTSTFVGQASGQVVTVDPGIYSVTGAVKTDYAQTVSSNCAGTITTGAIKFCTITYNDITTTLTVLANVINDNGGTIDTNGLTLKVDGTTVTVGQTLTVTPGAHSVTASDVANYTKSAWGYQCAADGTVILTAGDTKTCVINFNDNPPPAPSCAETVMVLDRTGSMSSTDLANEKTAANSLTDLYASVVPPATLPRLSVGSIGGLDGTGASIPLLGQLSTSYANIKSAITSITGSNSSVGSDLSAGIVAAQSELNSVRHEAGKEKVLLLVSDGDPNKPTGSMTTDTGFLYASSSVSESTGSFWNNPTGVYADGTPDATTSVAGSLQKERYFNFNIGGITGLPSGATISGIQAQADAWSDVPVTVATTTKTPTTIGTFDEWTANTGSVVSALTTNDSDTTYIDLSNNVETFVVANAGVPAGATINSVTITTVAKSTTAGAILQIVTEKGGTLNIGSNSTLTTNYTTYTRTLTTDPSTNNPWTLAEVNAWTTKFGVRSSGGAAMPRVTQFYVNVSYTPAVANTGLKSPIAVLGNPNNQFTNPTRAYASDNSYTTDTVNGHLQGYTTFTMGVPAGATVVGIDTAVEAKSTDNNGCQMGIEVAPDGLTFTTTGNVTTLGTSDSVYTLGGPTVTWGRAWSLAEVNGVNFAVRLKDIDPGTSCTNGSTLSVDQVQARVYYSLPAVTTGNLSPISVGAYSQWNSNTGTEISALTTNDSDTTYIDLSNNVETFAVTNAGVPAGATINSVTITTVAKSTTAGAILQLVTEKGGALNIGSNNTLTTNYTTYTRTLTTDPSTGNLWTLAEVNAWTTKFGVRSSGGAAMPRVTQVSVAVNYTFLPQPTVCQLGMDLSWNAGTTWTTPEKIQALTGAEATYSFGGATDDWSSTHTWAGSEFSNTNFRARVHAINPGAGCDATAIEHLDALRLKVFYTQPTDPIQAALNAADAAKRDGINIFTIHFGSDPGPYAGKKLLANLANGTVAVAGHENGSEYISGSGTSGDTTLKPPSTTHTPNQFTNPANAFASDNTYTTDVVNGNTQGYSAFNLVIPPLAIIKGVEVQVEAKSSDTSGCQIGAEVSWNGGATFTAVGQVNGVTGNDAVYTFGGSSNLWGRTWILDEFTNANYVVRIKDVDPGNACLNGSTLSVDQVRTRVYYTTADPENSDNDNFFVAPTSADMKSIFNYIANQVCPALNFTAASTPPTTGMVKVVTLVINNNGGSLTANSITTVVTPSSAVPNSFAGSGSGIDVVLQPGSYQIKSVAVPTGYVEVLGAGCSSADAGTITAGENRICVLTYDDIPPPPPPPDVSIHLGTWKELPIAN